MPREKSENSERTFGGLDLDGAGIIDGPNEKIVKKFLKDKGISLHQFTRSLYRGWLKTKKIGESDLDK